MLKQILILVSGATLAIAGFSRPYPDGFHRHDVSAEAHLRLGQHPNFKGVCKIEKEDRASDSCVLIAPGWVLTAGHTMHLARDFPLTVVFDSTRYVVEERVFHPEFAWGVDFGVDLALLKLDREVDEARPVRPYRERSEL